MSLHLLTKKSNLLINFAFILRVSILDMYWNALWWRTEINFFVQPPHECGVIWRLIWVSGSRLNRFPLTALISRATNTLFRAPTSHRRKTNSICSIWQVAMARVIGLTWMGFLLSCEHHLLACLFFLLFVFLPSSSQEDKCHSFDCDKEEKDRARPLLISLAQILVVNGKC